MCVQWAKSVDQHLNGDSEGQLDDKPHYQFQDTFTSKMVLNTFKKENLKSKKSHVTQAGH